MSTTKIQAMVKTYQQMEKMKNETIKEIDKDIDKKREKALEEIRKYLNEIAKSLEGIELSINIENSKIFSENTSIKFNSKYKIYENNQRTGYSEENKNWFIHRYGRYWKRTNKDYWNYIDNENEVIREGTNQWADGFINLIENWEEIKKEINKGIEKELNYMMDKTLKTTENKIRQYKCVEDFKA